MDVITQHFQDTTRDVERLRTHLKMLTGDYLTYSRIAEDRGMGDPSCRLCRGSYAPQSAPPDTITHILTECKGTAEVRERILPKLLNALLHARPNHIYLIYFIFIAYLTYPPSLLTLDTTFAQFILDCTSFNLSDQFRLSVNINYIDKMFCISRDLCYAVHSSRMKKLKLLKAQEK
jgi:hypothetical protein